MLRIPFLRILLGGKTPETAMSIKELADKMAYAESDIRTLVGRHASIMDPLQRAEVEMQIAERISIMEDFASKFKKAFLDRIDRNSRYIFKLLSGTDIKALLSRWPNLQQSLTNYLNNTNKTINAFRKDEYGDIEWSYGLRTYAAEIKRRVESNIGSTAKAIGQKIAAERKKREEESKKQQQTAKQSAKQRQAVSGQQGKL